MERTGQSSEPRHQDEARHTDDLVLGGDNKFTGLQLYFLRRLLRLVRMRQEQAGRLNAEGLRLLDRAIFSSYCDCLDQGVGSVAQSILHQFVPSKPPIAKSYENAGPQEE